MPPFREYLDRFPLVAILRGLAPESAEAVGDALVEGGFRIVEVPLNSPEPFRSIELMARRFGEEVLVGAGTVLHPGDVGRVRDAGGPFVVIPPSDEAGGGGAGGGGGRRPPRRGGPHPSGEGTVEHPAPPKSRC